VRIHSNSDIAPMAVCEETLPVMQYFLIIVHRIINVKFTLEQATKVQRWSIGIDLLFL